MRWRARAGGRASPCPPLPAQGRRAPRVKSQPQAGPAGTRSALDAWEYRPVPAPATSRPPDTVYARTSEVNPLLALGPVATTARIRQSSIEAEMGIPRNRRDSRLM